MIYIVTLLVFCVLNVFIRPDLGFSEGITVKKRFNRRSVFIIIVSIWIILLLTLKHDYVGTDTQNYRLIYNTISQDGYYDSNILNFNVFSEYGFYTLVYYLDFFNLDFRCLLFISAVIYVGTISYIIYKYSPKVLISYFIFFTFGYFIFNTTMRQCFALSFTTIALLFAIKNKILPYLIFTFLAIQFHATAIIFIPVYWILKLKIDKRTLIGSVVLLCLAIVFTSFLYSKAMLYIGKEYGIVATTGYSIILLNGIVLSVGLYYFKLLPKHCRYWILMIMYSVCIFPLSKLNPALFRLNMYFNIFMILLLPCLFDLKKQIIPILISGVLMFGIWNFVWGAQRAGIRIHPYVFYWEDYYELNPEARTLFLQ